MIKKQNYKRTIYNIIPYNTKINNNNILFFNPLYSHSSFNSGSVGKCLNTYKVNMVICVFIYKVNKKCLKKRWKIVLKNVEKVFKKMFNTSIKGGKI